MSIKIKIKNIHFHNRDNYFLVLDDIRDGYELVDSEVSISGYIVRKDDRKIQKLQYTSKGLFNRQVLGFSEIEDSHSFSKLHPVYKFSSKAKFNSKLHVAFLYPADHIRVLAVFEDKTKDCILSFNIEIESDIQNSYTEKVSPIKLLSLGRTGTTLFMNMLSAHPKIGVNNFFNESNISSYYLNNIKYTYPTIQRNNYTEGMANLENIKTIEDGNFIEFPFINNDSWYNYLYPKKLTKFAKETIDDYYLNASSDDISYFAEKGVVHDPTLTLMNQLYKKPKYIFLIRDFRDMYASIINFNKKRGFKAFGMENYKTDEEYIESLGRYCNNSFINAYENLKDKSMLVKYEDLINNKSETLKLVFEYLEIDRSNSIIDDIHNRTGGKSKDEQKHMTTQDINKSIGRYQEILDSDTIKLLNKSFEKSLKYFGYLT